MAMYAGTVNDDGTWDDSTSLGALLETKFSALSFREPASDADNEYNKKIAFQAQAQAIIEHILANMEINGIAVGWDEDTTGITGEAQDASPLDPHSHSVSITSTGNTNVRLTQKNGGTGLVE